VELGLLRTFVIAALPKPSPAVPAMRDAGEGTFMPYQQFSSAGYIEIGYFT